MSEKINLKISENAKELRSLRLDGIDKPIEEMTISELVQLRPGANAEDSYSVNAFTDNVSVSTSSIIEQVGQLAKERAMRAEFEEHKLVQLRERLGTLDHLGSFNRVLRPR
jgi:hypothetical protein